MATASFRSTTGRSSVSRCGPAPADSGSSTRTGSHRRSRSLSRYSGRFPPPPPESEDFPTPRGRFVNKLRGSGYAEICVDDLADEFFRARAESDEENSESSASRNRRRNGTASYLRETESSRHRGRSVSRHPDRRAAPSKGILDSASRRRRSLSVVRHRCSDSEDDVDSHNSSNQVKSRTASNSKLQKSSIHMPVKNGIALRRSMSQLDFLQAHDSYSSNSSSLTDDEARDFHSRKCVDEKTIRTVYVREKVVLTDYEHGENPKGQGDVIGLYDLIPKEIIHAVKGTEFEKVVGINEPSAIVSSNAIEPKSSEVLQAIAEIRRNFTTKLEQSEKRKQDLLAELDVEEERGKELCKIVKELLPSPKKSIVPERQSRSRRRINDRTRMSKRLTEEAEKYFEDFLSSMEDTDISSFDGERSDTSSIIRDPGLGNPTVETHESLLKTSLPEDEDGVLLPWLQWETSTGPLSPSRSKPGMPVSRNDLPAAATIPAQEANASRSNCSQTPSSLASCSPGGVESSSIVSRDRSRSKFGVENLLGRSSDIRTINSSFDLEEYQSLRQSEDVLFERLKQRQRIEFGSMILCGRLLT